MSITPATQIITAYPTIQASANKPLKVSKPVHEFDTDPDGSKLAEAMILGISPAAWAVLKVSNLSLVPTPEGKGIFNLVPPPRSSAEMAAEAKPSETALSPQVENPRLSVSA